MFQMILNIHKKMCTKTKTKFEVVDCGRTSAVIATKKFEILYLL